MKFLLTVANSYPECDPSGWLKSKDTLNKIQCTEDPELADIIIFVEAHTGDDPYFRNVIKHTFYKKYRHKCVLYHDSDLSITTLPTISPSIESWQFDAKHKRSFHYIARICENEIIEKAHVNYSEERSYLYSFSGGRTHYVRNKIFDLKHPDDTYLYDSTGNNAWDLDPEDKRLYELNYFNTTNKSSFILAPRGIGPCSYRLFETMQLGRVPVIISDEWVKPPNVDWDKFSVTIPESQIHLIPEILNERRNDAVEMGKYARENWERYFSPEVSLNQIAIAAKELLEHEYSIKDALKDYTQFLTSSWHFKNLLRHKKNQIKSKVSSLSIFT